MIPTRQKLLIVDDEASNLDIISEYLDEEAYKIDTAMNGKEALELLKNSENDYAAIVLDRMMPVMNGMELLKKIKENPRLKDIPVVMQSAAAQPEQVKEGIEAGVFYYITKPFERSVFLAILNSAIEYSLKRVRLKNDFKPYIEGMPLMQSAKFYFSNISELRNVCAIVSTAYPKAERAFFGINELSLNALEHGNYGISYEEKKNLLILKKWEETIANKESLAENKNKKVVLEFFNKANYYEVIIKDEGQGFNHEKYMDFDEARAIDPNGRGIAMSRKYSFDEIIYEDGGSKVIARMKHG